jgi:pyruvate dehydrogenase E1 component alpha subunit
MTELLQRMYADMLRIRMVEEAIAERYAEQEMRCPVHLSVGQEAAAVGVCTALRREDKVFSTHRCHAHYLAKGGRLKPMLAEIYGRIDGCIGGRGGSMHLTDPEVGMIASVPIVSSSIPLAVGSALSDRLDGSDAVTVTFFGDASVEEGVFHESMNFARLRNLAVLFVCENNLYSVYTPLSERQPDRPLVDIAKAHDVNAAQIDGNDPMAVHRVASDMAMRARRGQGPGFLVVDTYRWREHCGPGYDNDIGYRTENEFESWKKADPVARTREALLAGGRFAASDDAALAERFGKEIDEAFEFAKASPLPAPGQAAEHVYC